MDQDPLGFFPGASQADPRIPLLKLLGQKMLEVGKKLDDLAGRKELRDASVDIAISDLAIHAKAK